MKDDTDQADRERALRDAARAGDSMAWRILYDGAYEMVANFARWRCGGHADFADDALQEAWLTAARQLHRFDPSRARFVDWVRGIAANAVRRQIRSRARYRRRVRELGDADPAANAGDRDRAERIAIALAALPERYEQVLRAKYLDGESVDAIAVGTGKTPKAVESLLTRAREAFGETYGSRE